MKKKYDIIVIGSGAAGLTVAIGGINLGANILLIEKDKKLGGDCTHYGCIPSKTLISLAKSYDYKKLKVNIGDILKTVRENVRKVEKKSESSKYIKSLGIDLVYGKAKFIDKNTVRVNGKKYMGKNIVISSGAEAFIPKIKGLNKIKYLTNKSIFNLKKLKSLVIVGAGPIGCELGQALAKLGVQVTILANGKHILTKEDYNASQILEKKMFEDGVDIFTNIKIEEIIENNGKKIIITNLKKIKCDEVLIATGRKPKFNGLGLNNVKVKYNKDGIFTDKKCRTNIKNIYAIGDCAIGPNFTHFANHQGRVVLANILFKYPKEYSDKFNPRVTFTSPNIASVGILEGIELRWDYKDIDRAITDFKEDGFIKIFVDKKGYINGSIIVGEGADEMITQITIALNNNLKITDIADTIYPYPTYSYGIKSCADEFRKMKYTDDKKKWAKKLFGFGK